MHPFYPVPVRADQAEGDRLVPSHQETVDLQSPLRQGVQDIVIVIGVTVIGVNTVAVSSGSNVVLLVIIISIITSTILLSTSSSLYHQFCSVIMAASIVMESTVVVALQTKNRWMKVTTKTA